MNESILRQKVLSRLEAGIFSAETFIPAQRKQAYLGQQKHCKFMLDLSLQLKK